MNKKLLITLLVGVMSLILVNAALVTYLSNSVKAEVEVKSPMFVGISMGDETWEGDAYPQDEHDLDDWTTTGTLTLDPMYTGQDKTFTLYTMSANVADVAITGFEEAIVTNPLGVTCDDFESVIVSTDSIYGELGYGTEHELISDGCQEITWNTIQFGSPTNSLWNVTETDVSKMVVTFNDVIGTYTFSYRVIPAK